MFFRVFKSHLYRFFFSLHKSFHHVVTQGPEFEGKIAKLVELGFSREAVIQALRLFEGNEEQAAGFLFGG